MSDGKLSPRELVLQKYPGAHIDDDGGWVYVLSGRLISKRCSECGHVSITKDTSSTIQNTLGSGNCLNSAWESAAKKLGLIPQ